MWLCPKFWALTLLLHSLYQQPVTLPWPELPISYFQGSVISLIILSLQVCMHYYCLPSNSFLDDTANRKQHHLLSHFFLAWVFMLEWTAFGREIPILEILLCWGCLLGTITPDVLGTYCRINLSPRNHHFLVNCHFQSIVVTFSNIRMNGGDTGSESVRLKRGRKYLVYFWNFKYGNLPTLAKLYN